MEKTPSSLIIGKRRGEMTWMPEKARVSGSGDAVADGFCVAASCGAQPGVAPSAALATGVLLERRPRS